MDDLFHFSCSACVFSCPCAPGLQCNLDPDLFFDDPGESQGQDEATPDPLPDVVGEVLNGQSEMNNTLESLHGIIDIDDDNKLAPKNVPAPTDDPVGYVSTDWGHSGKCCRHC